MKLTDIQLDNLIDLMAQAPAMLDIVYDVIKNYSDEPDLKKVCFTCVFRFEDLTNLAYELRIEDSQLHLSKELVDKIIKEFLGNCILDIGNKRIIQFDLLKITKILKVLIV